MEADTSKVDQKSQKTHKNMSTSMIQKSSDKLVTKIDSKEESVFAKKDSSFQHNLTQSQTKRNMTIESSASEGWLTAIILNNLTTVTITTQHLLMQ